MSLEELEAVLARRRLEARQKRVEQFQKRGRASLLPSSRPAEPASVEVDSPAPRGRRRGADTPPRKLGNRLLLGVEVMAVAGLVYVLFSGIGVVRTLNQEVAEALGGPTAQPTPLITAVVLPSGHTPPTAPGGALPNEAEIPEHLRPLVQSLAPVAIPTTGPEQARSIFIPALWELPAPVVQGDGWEQLKKGVAQHIGSSDPGVSGNLVLSAHNDIFGELFRDLDRLQPGDEIVVSTATREYVYRVTGLRIVEPTEVSVMEPTPNATITLISCYPYLIDTQRIVVFADLVEG
ncbi:MAG: class D sortase [Anaerolineales bacterium]